MALARRETSDVPVVVLDTIDSTNAEAMRRIAGGERGPLWLMAREQTGGRGRSGRAWSSPPGNCYASLIVTLDCEPAVAHHLSLLAGVAVIDAIRAVGGGDVPGLRLKWPNDVLASGGKLAGILAESTTDVVTRQLVAVIGVGTNLVAAPQVPVQALGRDVADLAALNVATTPEEFLGALSSAMDHWLAIWDNGRAFGAIRQAWMARAGVSGEAITVNSGAGPVSGDFVGIDADGALLLIDQHSVSRRFTYGDVTLGAGSTGLGRVDG